MTIKNFESKSMYSHGSPQPEEDILVWADPYAPARPPASTTTTANQQRQEEQPAYPGAIVPYAYTATTSTPDYISPHPSYQVPMAATTSATYTPTAQSDFSTDFFADGATTTPMNKGGDFYSNSNNTHVPTTTQNGSYHSASTASISPEFKAMKKHRQRAQLAAGCMGGVTGLVFLGPFGAVFGALAGNKITKLISKRHERKAKDKYERQSFQESVDATAAPLYEAVSA
jgi:hypothetical protein